MKLQPFNNPLTQSSMNWRLIPKDSIKQPRPFSLARYANRYQQHAKDGFVYWPKDNVSKKPKSKDSKLYTHRNYVSLLIF